MQTGLKANRQRPTADAPNLRVNNLKRDADGRRAEAKGSKPKARSRMPKASDHSPKRNQKPTPNPKTKPWHAGCSENFFSTVIATLAAFSRNSSVAAQCGTESRRSWHLLGMSPKVEANGRMQKAKGPKPQRRRQALA